MQNLTLVQAFWYTWWVLTRSVDFKLKLLFWGGGARFFDKNPDPKVWKLRSARVAQVPDLALKKVQCMWRQDWHKCRIRKGCVTLGTGNVCYLAFKIHVMHRSVFFERGSKEFWLASSFEGHGSSLRSLPHPSNYPRTPDTEEDGTGAVLISESCPSSNRHRQVVSKLQNSCNNLW